MAFSRSCAQWDFTGLTGLASDSLASKYPSTTLSAIIIAAKGFPVWHSHNAVSNSAGLTHQMPNQCAQIINANVDKCR